MRILAVVLLVLVMAAGCSKQPTQPLEARPGPFFVGVDTSKLPEPAHSAVAAAEKDIDLVLRGFPPACKSEPDSAMSDGGTALYKCKYYDLTVMQSIYQVGDVYGAIYGPIVTFPGDYPISFVRFYSNDSLRALLNH